MSLNSAPEESSGGVSVSRRQLLAAGAAGAASAAAVAAGTAEAGRASGYPRLRIIQLSKLERNKAVKFNYPLERQPNVLVDFGQPVPAGIGPNRSIVAYSRLCQHMGCEVEYRPFARELNCPCHQTRYDPERKGSIIQGVAMQPLPRVLLEVRRGAVWAVGIDGLIYGYRSNLTPGDPVSSPIRPARASRRCGRFATRLTSASARSWASLSPQESRRQQRPQAADPPRPDVTKRSHETSQP